MVTSHRPLEHAWVKTDVTVPRCFAFDEALHVARLAKAKVAFDRSRRAHWLWVFARFESSCSGLDPLVPGALGWWSLRNSGRVEKTVIHPTPLIDCPITDFTAVKAALDDGKVITNSCDEGGAGQGCDVLWVDCGAQMKVQVGYVYLIFSL